MSLKLGSTSIGSLYLGSTKIGAAYLGNVKVYNSDSPYTLFFRLPSTTNLRTDSAETIDVRSAGMPTTSDLPVVAFYAQASCTMSSISGNAGEIILATTDENIVGLGIQNKNSYSLDYGGTTQTIVSSMSLSTSIRKMKWIFEYSTTSNQWNYTPYYAARGGFIAVGSPISIGTNTPFDINRWYSNGNSTRSYIILNNLTAVGFKNISDAISWTGAWPIT